MRKKISFHIIIIIFAFLAFWLFALEPAHAYTFYIDEFSVTRSGPFGPVIFDDTFNNNSPPPSAPNFTNGTPASYFVDGTMVPELNTTPNPGKLRLDSSGAVPLTNPLGQPFIHQRAILETPILPASNSGLKLKSSVTFSATGVFDLVIPSELREAYDVMFNDGATNHTPNDIAMMRVIRTQTNNLMVQLAHLDFEGHSTTVIEQTPLETNHEQIALTLTKELADSNAITGSFYYIDLGIPGPTTTFATTMDIFHGENFTRAEFEAFTPAPAQVPEPGTMLLLGSGLLGLWGFRKKLKK